MLLEKAKLIIHSIQFAGIKKNMYAKMREIHKSLRGFSYAEFC